LAIERDVSVEHMLYIPFIIIVIAVIRFLLQLLAGLQILAVFLQKTPYGALSRPLERSCAEFCAKYAAGPQIICAVFPQSKNLQTGHHFSLKII